MDCDSKIPLDDSGNPIYPDTVAYDWSGVPEDTCPDELEQIRLIHHLFETAFYLADRLDVRSAYPITLTSDDSSVPLHSPLRSDTLTQQVQRVNTKVIPLQLVDEISPYLAANILGGRWEIDGFKLMLYRDAFNRDYSPAVNPPHKQVISAVIPVYPHPAQTIPSPVSGVSRQTDRSSDPVSVIYTLERFVIPGSNPIDAIKQGIMALPNMPSSPLTLYDINRMDEVIFNQWIANCMNAILWNSGTVIDTAEQAAFVSHVSNALVSVLYDN